MFLFVGTIIRLTEIDPLLTSTNSKSVKWVSALKSIHVIFLFSIAVNRGVTVFYFTKQETRKSLVLAPQKLKGQLFFAKIS